MMLKKKTISFEKGFCYTCNETQFHWNTVIKSNKTIELISKCSKCCKVKEYGKNFTVKTKRYYDKAKKHGNQQKEAESMFTHNYGNSRQEVICGFCGVLKEFKTWPLESEVGIVVDKNTTRWYAAKQIICPCCSLDKLGMEVC